MHYVDLHIHTNFSDSSFSPEDIVEHAHKINLSAIAITDHDITDGIEPTLKLADKYSIEVIAGIELSGHSPDKVEDEMHILGFYIDYNNREFQENLHLFRQTRQKRAHKILDKLKELNIFINEKLIFDNNSAGVVGRLHFAKALLEESYVFSIQDAFNKYLGYGKPAFVPKIKMSSQEAIQMILDINGIPVLAHPDPEKVRADSVKKLVNEGLQGIEIYHRRATESSISYFKNLVQEHKLLITGGSDCHGLMHKNEPSMGTLNIPYSLLENMKKHRKYLC